MNALIARSRLSKIPGLSGFTPLPPGQELSHLQSMTRMDSYRVSRSSHAVWSARGFQPGKTALCTAWTGGVQTFVYNGGRVVLLQQAHGLPGPLPVLPMPYWREALKLAEPHPAWGDFPWQQPGLQFYGLAPDCALDASSLLPSSGWRPILRRLDTRGMDLHEYIMELNLGSGRAIISTLRLQGGLGDQPSSLRYNLAGQWLPGRLAALSAAGYPAFKNGIDYATYGLSLHLILTNDVKSC